jgi:hypothetical protein
MSKWASDDVRSRRQLRDPGDPSFAGNPLALPKYLHQDLVFRYGQLWTAVALRGAGAIIDYSLERA